MSRTKLPPDFVKLCQTVTAERPKTVINHILKHGFITTQELKEAAYRLRYQVYCVENSYERPDEQMGGRETDLYDDRSVHALLIHKRSGAVAGTVRVILPEADTQGLSLPIKVVTDSHHRELLRRLPYSQTAEISRFAHSAYRTRAEYQSC